MKEEAEFKMSCYLCKRHEPKGADGVYCRAKGYDVDHECAVDIRCEVFERKEKWRLRMGELRFWHVWDEDREPRGIFRSDYETPCKTKYPYQMEIKQSPCPEEPVEPDWPDGWYLVTCPGGNVALREKRGDHVHKRNKEMMGWWDQYSVVASLEGVKFVNEEDDK